jgi:hypothetical protein
VSRAKAATETRYAMPRNRRLYTNSASRKVLFCRKVARKAYSRQLPYDGHNSSGMPPDHRPKLLAKVSVNSGFPTKQTQVTLMDFLERHLPSSSDSGGGMTEASVRRYCRGQLRLLCFAASRRTP